MSTTGGASWTEIDRAMRAYNFRVTKSIYEVGSYYNASVGASVMTLRIQSTGTWTQYLLTETEGIAYSVLPNPDDPSTIYVGGTNGNSPILLRTTNSGSTWEKLGANVFTTSWESISVLECGKGNSNKIFAGSNTGLYISSDAGASWLKPLQSQNVTCVVIDPSNENNVYVGTSGGVKYSTNGGTTWTSMNENLTNLIIESMDYDSLNKVLYVGTQSAGVFRRNLPVTDVEEQVLIPDRVQLHQNYPNPFNPSTVISFAVPREGYYRLAVYNILGQEVAVLLAETVSEGPHAVHFDAQHLRSGTYFYRFSGGGSTVTRKMTVLK